MKPQFRAILERRFLAWSSGRARSAFVAASLLGLLVMAESASAQCYGGAISISAVSGNNQTGALNTPLPSPLVVQVTEEAAAGRIPCPGVGVVWAVTSGSGTLAVSQNATDSKGEASNRLTIGNTPSPITVMATIPGGAAVAFTANTTSVAAGLGTIATLPSVAVVSATRQTTNIGVRLASLRGGGPQFQVNVSGLFPKDTGEPGSAGLAESLLPVGVGDGMGGRLGLFLNGQGNFGRQDAIGDEQGFDFHTAGFTLGSDYRVTNNFILGGAVGYLSAGSKVDHDAADLSAQGFTLSAFATYYLGKMFWLDGIFTYGWNWYDTERQTTAGTVRGSPDGTQLAVSASTGADFAFGRLTVGPYGRLDYVRIEVDSFREQGDSTQTLNVGSQEVTSLTTALGAQASYAFSTPYGVLLPIVRAEWQHEFEDDPTSVVGSLTSDPTSTFTVVTTVPDRDYFRLGIGLSATFRRGVSAFLYSDAVVGRDSFTNYGFTGGIRLEF
jgi:uncharacterized protein YhjY with autotransporter beta-barrel domain